METNVNSKLIKEVLAIMQEKGYIGSYEEVEDSRGSFLKVSLIGKLNNCGVIKPRFSVKLDEFEKFEKRFLPAKGFGIIIISTNKGLMTHDAAKAAGIGGRLISYCY